MASTEPYWISSCTCAYYAHPEPVYANVFWSHFKRCLKEIPEIIPVARICEVILRPIFAMRSHPRWRSRRWKAKT